MNPLTDLGLLSGAHDLRRRLEEAGFRAPLHTLDGSTLFVWRGRAESVELKTWMPGFPPSPPFQRLSGSDIWILALRLPESARIEYRIALSREGRSDEILDPLNPITSSNPFGSNSVATGPGYERPDWSLPHPESPAGTVSSLSVGSSVWGKEVEHLLYVPAAAADSTRRLLVVHDGGDFLRFSGLATVLDNLIAAGTISPLVALLHQPHDRISEYGGSERHETHILDELIPLIRRRLDMEDRILALGSSLGAVAALSLGWNHPDRVNGLALLSGSFANRITPDRPAEVFGSVVDLVARVASDRRLAGAPAYVSCGRYESLVDLNRALVPRLRACGIQVRYQEVWEGHNWGSWRDRLQAALTWCTG